MANITKYYRILTTKASCIKKIAYLAVNNLHNLKSNTMKNTAQR